MSHIDAMRDAFSEAIQKLGGQAHFAQRLSTDARPVSQQLVSYWLKKGELPAELVLRVELLTAIPRERLRPDVFCLPDDVEASAA
ncbi:MAG: helix-turn-helix domain-containing protein [Gammaproteobacteria bacterium]|uniref:Putative antitoxin n=1 Tax=viral metagenome TaxID=1070528 RepID=A0A6M3J4D1_9ZZZZ|nr:helix-turn-helix domain-containing protein [Gammaproteobacteria bacterium]MBU2067494.1 helix-turn-helix domain-containing protein [Gammaproteobacteria bacterium]MBU2139504.1 helix-turn-helix domain-containing protein [Gammaproteobacteria bacterium]MBU2255931.1 helix-turn-helix domain-containing protein [Gammaproteobacteria bacterium]MBU2295576.1 helix-turn-helix domain-containing protein [Gammaproteobacteria bacterium]